LGSFSEEKISIFNLFFQTRELHMVFSKEFYESIVLKLGIVESQPPSTRIIVAHS
jgi:hypothetical protein